ncbi:MAG: phosphoribosylformylglycinamidine cyclo-ligase [Leptolyngbyaceae cyanobacterium SL_1_1]|nr:phosphoribosylformylglycinamidine cyclo-ligase [Leptolyngbyaceae cyanobacterium RM1_1_2]NJO09093.1 phosphoribosylformylglycinamidine cyclo-ligase [Leptolyngbyaceae cyanobacterium SL_1_1]
MDYRSAGVDVEAGQNFAKQIRQLVNLTHRPEVLGSLGGFSGLFQLPTGYREPVLVAGTDGVGTKLKIAQALNRHETIGLDLVAMCVNDVLTCGAEPLFFLDYLATGKLEPSQLTQVVSGIAAGCQQAGCALLGGETAEMPGFYQTGAYDLAGFCVGVVEKQQILSGDRVQVGDVAIGLASQGVHSNGYSLVRKVISEGIPLGQTQPGYAWSDRPKQLLGKSLGEVLLEPTRLYVEPVLKARQQGLAIHSMAHITGGGLPENLPRCLGANQSVQLELGSWHIPLIFDWLAIAGDISPSAMFNTFNMGIGLVVLVDATEANAALQSFQKLGIDAYRIGEVVEGKGEVLGLPQE